MVEILETCQWIDCAGETLPAALARLEAEYHERAQRSPYALREHRALAIDPARDRCPWGRSWFKADETGALQLWRSNWDSSG